MNFKKLAVWTIIPAVAVSALLITFSASGYSAVSEELPEKYAETIELTETKDYWFSEHMVCKREMGKLLLPTENKYRLQPTLFVI